MAWTVTSALLTLSMYRAHALNFQIIAATFFDVIILILALRYGEKWEWSKFDVACVVLSGVSIVLWQSTGDPFWGVVFNAAAVTLASFPLFKGVWFKPEIEKPLPWFIMTLSSICAVMALRHWSVESATQPVVYLVIAAVVVVLTLLPARPTTKLI